jgi:hypothetical protein
MFPTEIRTWFRREKETIKKYVMFWIRGNKMLTWWQMSPTTTSKNLSNVRYLCTKHCMNKEDDVITIRTKNLGTGGEYFEKMFYK